jgi:hypothetical protein
MNEAAAAVEALMEPYVRAALSRLLANGWDPSTIPSAAACRAAFAGIAVEIRGKTPLRTLLELDSRATVEGRLLRSYDMDLRYVECLWPTGVEEGKLGLYLKGDLEAGEEEALNAMEVDATLRLAGHCDAYARAVFPHGHTRHLTAAAVRILGE